MNFRELLQKRRSIRRYEAKQVPLTVLKEMINETRLAPTAGNRQPCSFTIVQERKLIKEISDECKRNLLSDISENPDSQYASYEHMFRNEDFNVFYNAPTVVFVTGDKGWLSLDHDSALTISYLMFAATARKLGTCWVHFGTIIHDREIIEKLGIPSGHKIVAAVLVGYPESIPAPSPRKDPAIISIIR